jgi:hypothetical protein
MAGSASAQAQRVAKAEEFRRAVCAAQPNDLCGIELRHTRKALRSALCEKTAA